MSEDELDLALERVLDALDDETRDWSLEDRVSLLEMLDFSLGQLLSADRGRIAH